MPGFNEFVGGGGGNAPSSSGGARGSFNDFVKGGAAPAKKDKKKGGLFGGAIRLGGSLLGEVGEFLSAPQQALFKGVKGVGQIASGDVKQGVGTLGSAGKSAAMFSFPGSSALLEDKPISATQALQPFGVTKLPRGLDTGLSLVADPLNFATFGTGSLAKQGLKVAGPELAERIAKQGLRKGLNAADREILQGALVRAAEQAGSKNAEKTAARQMRALATRGRGGIGAHIPGTSIGGAIIPGSKLAPAGRAAGSALDKVPGVAATKGALSRALIPGRAVTEAVGSSASGDVLDAQARRQHTASSLAEDWQKRVQAAMDDYKAQPGKTFETADDEAVHAALEAGPEAVAALRASRPELARVIDTFDAVRREQAEMQRARGLLLSEDEIRAGETARRQRPVLGRIAARDAELDDLNAATDVPPVPPSAAQQRAAGKLAERVRRAEATARGEVARGQRLLAAAGRDVERSQTRAANRTGQVIGRARGRLEEAGQLETGLAARQRQAVLAAKRAEKAAEKAEARAAKTPAPKPAKAAADAPAAKTERELDERIGREIAERDAAKAKYDAVRAKDREFDTLSDEGLAEYHSYLKELDAAAKVLSEKSDVVKASMAERRAPYEAAEKAAKALEAAKAAPAPKLSGKTRAEGAAAAKRAAADEARAAADEIKGVKPAPSLSKVKSDVNLDAQRAHTASKVETETVAKMAGREVERQAEAVARAQKRVAAAKTQEQETLARFELKNAQRAEKAIDRRVRQLIERNARDRDTLAKIAQDVLDDPNIITDDRYLHRIMTPEGQKALDKIEAAVRGTGGSASAALKQGALKMRTIAREYTANQINDAIRVLHEGGAVGDVELANAVKGIAQQLEPGSKLYKESAVVSLVDRGVEAAKAIAAADYIKALRGIPDDTGRAILLSADDAAALKLAGEELADDLVEFKLGKHGTFYAPKAVKAEIVGAMGRLEDPDGLAKALDSADKWWRSQVTASLPGGIPFATRNARSNVMLMWLSGTNVPKYMREGAALQRDVRRVLKTHAADVADQGVEAAMKAHLSPRQFKLWDYARKSGITGDAFYTVELGGTAPGIKVKGAAKEGRLPRRAVRAAFGTQGAAAQKGRQLNEIVEQHARLSQFLADVDRLGDLEEAARRTKDVLFDYSALTPTEKKIKRWGMPFYTFARKNIPGQVRRFIEAPGRFVLPEKIAKVTTEDLPEGSPEYQARQGSRVSKVPGLLGMVTTPERPLHAAAKTLDPILQLASGRGQLGLRGALSNFGGVPGAPLKAGFEQATGTSVFTGYKLPKSAADRQKLAAQTALPSLGRQPFGAYLPTATPSQTKKRQAPNLAKALSVLGVGLQPVNEKELKRQKRLADAAKRAERG